MTRMFIQRTLLICLICVLVFEINAQNRTEKIDRHAVVSRYNVVNTTMDTLSSLTVGNGRFAFTVDATGLQSFPVHYEKGIPLGTQSEWGWGRFTNTEEYRFEETLKDYQMDGRGISYPVQSHESKRKRDAANWFRQNTHRLQLGNIGLVILKKDGTEARPEDIENIQQELDLWTGGIKSHFTVEGESVNVLTYGHADQDGVGVQIHSSLLKEDRLAVRIRFPYVSNNLFSDWATNYNDSEKHESGIVLNNPNAAILAHQIDSASYRLNLTWKDSASLKESKKHEFIFTPGNAMDQFEFSAIFTGQAEDKYMYPDFAAVKKSSTEGWNKFWNSGAVIDFSGSTDPRANELERRVVLSQYLTKVQCAGNEPPQETGLTYNSWFGKAHLEMHWWHGVHFALWNRTELLTSTLGWYQKIQNKGRKIALRQGFDGIRWPKMVDNQGNESPSNIAPFLIWQQPHFIYMAELAYRADKSNQILDKYKDLVFATADFMASFAYFDKTKNGYILGPGIITSQEVSSPEETINPPYELAYWYWGLSIAQQWKERLNESRIEKWDDVLLNLSLLPQKDGVYLAQGNAPDSYTNPKYLKDHPAVLATYGMLPYTKMVDTAVMQSSYDLIRKTWNWSHTWGWDFPMTAMTLARLGRTEEAVEALFTEERTNTYLPNGHNYQNEQLTLYLPGNGGLLTAVAMMCAGWDGSTSDNPGFPKNGQWNIKWEGLAKMP